MSREHLVALEPKYRYKTDPSEFTQYCQCFQAAMPAPATGGTHDSQGNFKHYGYGGYTPKGR
jgi:hypothetical protein